MVPTKIYSKILVSHSTSLRTVELLDERTPAIECQPPVLRLWVQQVHAYSSSPSSIKVAKDSSSGQPMRENSGDQRHMLISSPARTIEPRSCRWIIIRGMRKVTQLTKISEG